MIEGGTPPGGILLRKDQAASPRFPGQFDDERVVLLVHRHWLYFARSIVIAAVGIALAVGLTAWLLATAGERESLWTGWFWLPIGLLALAAFWIWAMHQEWLNDIYVLTDRRVVAVKRVYGVFEQRREIGLGRLQDVSVSASGVLPYLFRFADVTVASAGASGGFRLEGVPEPDALKDAIIAAADLVRGRALADEQQALRRELAARLGRAPAAPRDTTAR